MREFIDQLKWRGMLHDVIPGSEEYLSKNKRVVFIGQSVSYSGNAIYNTLSEIDKKKKIEMPVFEDTQMGMSIGMALTGQRIISIFPRWNFLLCATNQLVSHLDKFPTITDNNVTPNIIIRTSVGSQRPLFPGHQHIGNLSEAYRKMLSNVEIIELEEPEHIFESYKKAYGSLDDFRYGFDAFKFYYEFLPKTMIRNIFKMRDFRQYFSDLTLKVYDEIITNVKNICNESYCSKM